MRRHLRQAMAMFLALVLMPAIPGSPLAPQHARAATTTFTSDTRVGLSRGVAFPYPSTINVTGLSGTVMHVRLTLTDLMYRHQFTNIGCGWDELDIMLSGPGGQVAMVMSDVPRNGNVTDAQRTLTFDDNSSIPLPSDGSVESGSYAPTDYEPGDSFPSPAPSGPYGTNFSTFTGSSANGLWSLYAVSERVSSGCQGGIGSWSLTIIDGATFSNPAPITIPGVGEATPYPSIISISDIQGGVTQVTAELSGLNHTFVQDLQILLVSPAGIGVILMADVGGGNNIVNATIVFDDVASRGLPVSATRITSGSYRPTDFEAFSGELDSFPAPAPNPPFASSMEAFFSADPNGVWSLYVYDHLDDDEGDITGGWRLSIETDATAPVTTATVAPPRNAAGWSNADVTVSLNATDDELGVQKIVYEAQGALDIAPTTTFTSSVLVAIAAEGITTLRFAATDVGGNVESTKQRVIQIDKTPPSATQPLHRLAPSIGTSNVDVALSWSGSDATSGIVRYVLQKSVNGSAFTAVVLPAPTATSVTLTLAPGSYKFRTRSIDKANNESAFKTGATFQVVASEESRVCSSTVISNCLTYTGLWAQEAVAGAHGGNIRSNGVAGKTATFTFAGTHVSWVAMKGPDRGKAQVSVDGTVVATVDLFATRSLRSIVYLNNALSNGMHTLEIRVLGTKRLQSNGTKVNVDVLSVLKRP